MLKISGIYKITCTITQSIYIGQAVDCLKREKYYKGAHCSHQFKIYNSIKKYGWENHTYEIIKKCEREDLNKWEVFYIDFFKSFNTPHGLNLTSGGDTCNKVSPETIAKRIEKTTGQKRSLESRKRMSLSQMGKHPSKETNINRGLSIKKNHWCRSEKASEIIERIKVKRIGIKLSNETKDKIKKARKFQIITDESKEKRRKSMLLKCRDSEWLNNRSEKIREGFRRRKEKKFQSECELFNQHQKNQNI